MRHSTGLSLCLLCVAMVTSQAWGIAVPLTAKVSNLGSPPEAGTGLRGQVFDSGGTLASLRTLLAASTAPDRVWNVTTVDYPKGGGHNTASDSAGLNNLLGSDASGININNVDNTRFAMRGYLRVESAMDLNMGDSDIDIRLQLQSDDDGNIVLGGELDADGTTGSAGLNLARNTAHTLEFPETGYYQLDILWQEGGGSTGATFSIDAANVVPGQINTAATVVPQSFMVPNTVDTPAPGLIQNVPLSAKVPLELPGKQTVIPEDPGLAVQFFDSGGNIASIRTLLANATAPNRTFLSTKIDYPNGGTGNGHNTQADNLGLISYLGVDAASLTPNMDIANIDNSRFAFRGYLNVTEEMDLMVDGGMTVEVRLRVNSDDDANIVIGGGPDGDGTTADPGLGLNLGRNADWIVSFPMPGVYQFDILFQEGGGNSGITLFGDFRNLSFGDLAITPASIIPTDGYLFQTFSFATIPEPASATMLLAGALAMIRRRKRD